MIWFFPRPSKQTVEPGPPMRSDEQPGPKAVQSSGQSTMIILEYEGRRVLARRPGPSAYYTFTASLRLYFPEIPQAHPITSLQTNEHPICQGEWIDISEDVWSEIAATARSLKVASYPSLTPSTPAEDPVPAPTEELIELIMILGTGHRHYIEAAPNDTIATVKGLIGAVSGVRADAQRLIWAGKYLEDNRTLRSYNISDGSSIHVTTSLRGGKPVIYLYPPATMTVTARLGLVPEWEISAIYPVVPIKSSDEGQLLEWTVDAAPCGTLRDSRSGLETSYLFWEAETNGKGVLSPPATPRIGTGQLPRGEEYFVPSRPSITPENAVVMSVDKVPMYLDRTLKILGLHTEARTSFITYWLPSITKHTTIALRFLPQSAYERAAPLTVTPTPDVLIRVFMLFRGIPESEKAMWSGLEDDDDGVAASGSASVDVWSEIVGARDAAAKMADTSVFRVLEWGGMEVLT